MRSTLLYASSVAIFELRKDNLRVMQPEQRIHRADRWRTHVAMAASSPVMQHIVNVFAGGIVLGTPLRLSLFGGELGERRDEQNSVKPIAKSA